MYLSVEWIVSFLSSCLIIFIQLKYYRSKFETLKYFGILIPQGKLDSFWNHPQNQKRVDSLSNYSQFWVSFERKPSQKMSRMEIKRPSSILVWKIAKNCFLWKSWFQLNKLCILLKCLNWASFISISRQIKKKKERSKTCLNCGFKSMVDCFPILEEKSHRMTVGRNGYYFIGGIWKMKDDWWFLIIFQGKFYFGSETTNCFD